MNKIFLTCLSIFLFVSCVDSSKVISKHLQLPQVSDSIGNVNLSGLSYDVSRVTGVSDNYFNVSNVTTTTTSVSVDYIKKDDV